MKTKKTVRQITRLTLDSRNRLLAYTTAASVGAFFAGQSVEGQVVQSSALSPYPQTLTPGSSPYGAKKDYFYLNVDGGGNEFNLVVDDWRLTFGGIPRTTSFALNPTSSSYIIPWTTGMYVGPSSGSKPTYKDFLANSQYQTKYLFNNFTTTGALAFEFVSPLDSQVHFGYMNIKVNGAPGVYGDFSATVNGIYYNETPNAGITIGAVPEPSSLALLAAGLAGLAVRRVRRQRS